MEINKRTKVVALAIALAAPAEGLYQVAYKDPVGVLTVCYGHTGSDIRRDKRYSIAECRALLDKDMLEAVDTVNACVPGLPDETLAAFADAAFNVGPKIACDQKRSTAARMLKAGDIKGACNQLPRWNKASVAGLMVELPGLTKRRAKERDLCLSGLKA